jgi:drug/metabolite transporter (DMT)-like permease
VPGGIIAGVGTGLLLATNLEEPAGGGALVLSLAGGFLAIFAVSKLTRHPEHHFWPLIPGTILGVVGTAITVGQPGIIEYAGVVAAGIMVLAGLALVWRGWTGGHGHRPAWDQRPPRAPTGSRRPPG